MNFQPLRDIVLIEREAPEQQIGSIIIAGNQEEPNRGTVIKLGPGRVLENGELVKPSVKEGDRVLFSPTSGFPVKLGTNNDDNMIIMGEQEIIGILHD